MIPDFMTESPCSRLDPEAMFPAPSNTDAIDFAKQQVCGDCTFRLQCLEWALNPQSRCEYGIFGGHTAAERRYLIKERKLAKTARLDYGTFPPKHKRLTPTV